MIYSQTSSRNGPVHVSIRADGDASTLTFLDSRCSAVLSLLLYFPISDTLPRAPTQQCTSPQQLLLFRFSLNRFLQQIIFQLIPSGLQEKPAGYETSHRPTERPTPHSKFDLPASPTSGCCSRDWADTGPCFHCVSYCFHPQSGRVAVYSLQKRTVKVKARLKGGRAGLHFRYV